MRYPILLVLLSQILCLQLGSAQVLCKDYPLQQAQSAAEMKNKLIPSDFTKLLGVSKQDSSNPVQQANRVAQGIQLQLAPRSASVNVNTWPQAAAQAIKVPFDLPAFPVATQRGSPPPSPLEALSALKSNQRVVGPVGVRAFEMPTLGIRTNIVSSESYFSLTRRLLPRSSNGNDQMTGGGSPTEPGAGGGIDTQNPLAFDKSGSVPCLRPATASDLAISNLTNTSNRAFDPAGFRDVGMLLFLTRRQGSIDPEWSICSFVRVGRKFAVTAAHCVLNSGKGQVPRVVDLSNHDLEAYALTPKFKVTSYRPEMCVVTPNDCGYFASRVRSAAIWEKSSWPEDSDYPLPDFALLNVDFPDSMPAPITGIAPKASLEKLTLAGLGLTDAADALFYGTLGVAWPENPKVGANAFLSWDAGVVNGIGTGCNGDSGGAVFDGNYSGFQKEVHWLVAVISNGVPDRNPLGSDIERCRGFSKGLGSRLDTYQSWFCDKSLNQVIGCFQNQPKPVPGKLWEAG